MSINISEAIWTVICFVVLLIVLKTFLFTPLIRFMDERQRRIDEGRALESRAQAERASAEHEAEESWKQRNEESKKMVADGRAADAQCRTQALAQAHREAAEAAAAGRERVEDEERQARARLAQQSGALAQKLADRLLEEPEAAEGEGGHDS